MVLETPYLKFPIPQLSIPDMLNTGQKPGTISPECGTLHPGWKPSLALLVFLTFFYILVPLHIQLFVCFTTTNDLPSGSILAPQCFLITFSSIYGEEIRNHVSTVQLNWR